MAVDDPREFGRFKHKLGCSYIMALVACFQRNWVRLREAEDMVAISKKLSEALPV